MLVANVTNPSMSTYCLGGVILKALNTFPSGEVDPELLYVLFEKMQEGVSYEVFIYALSWLYIIGAVDSTKDGKIRRCFLKVVGGTDVS